MTPWKTDIDSSSGMVGRRRMALQIHVRPNAIHFTSPPRLAAWTADGHARLAPLRGRQLLHYTFRQSPGFQFDYTDLQVEVEAPSLRLTRDTASAKFASREFDNLAETEQARASISCSGPKAMHGVSRACGRAAI